MKQVNHYPQEGCPETKNVSKGVQNYPAVTVCTIKGVYIKSSNALFEVHKKAPSVYTSKTASSSLASVKTDCAAQRKSVR